MTNATDALRAWLDSFVTEMEGLTRRYGEPVNTYTRKLRHLLNETAASPATINHDGIDRKLIDDATPAGSASGEVPFAVVGGVVFDSPQALCAAHADLQDEVARLNDWLSTAASALSIALDRAETAEAALAEARRDAERYRWLRERELTVSRHNLVPSDQSAALDAHIDAAMGSANGQG